MEERLQAELQQLAELGRLQERIPVERIHPDCIQRLGVDFLDFSSFDFLDISSESGVKRAAQRAIEDEGVCSKGPRVGVGNSRLHLQAEARLSEFLVTQDSLLFSSFNQAILTLIAALLGEGDCVVVPEEVSAPVADAAHLVNVDCINFSVEDGESLASALQAATSRKNCLVFVEAVSPITGMTADLKQISATCAAHDAPVVVDQSYSLGSFGVRGAGLIEHHHLGSACFARIGDLAPGVGVPAGFVSGSEVLVSYLFNRSRTLATEAAIPVSIAAALPRALDKIELLAASRTQLVTLAHRLKIELVALGLPAISDSDSPVVALPFPRFQEASTFREALQQQGIYADALHLGRHKSEGSVVRFILTRRHSENDVDRLLEAVSQVKVRLRSA
jgi:7-keto-8-aminopelargonate synthetase-like enzyme